MKQLIVLSAVILFLLFFPLQYALEQQNHHNISQFQLYVNIAKEKAKQQGMFTDEIKEELENNIINEFKNISKDEIIINTDNIKKYRTEIINYEIGVPIKKLLASQSFWGITNEENQFTYTIKGVTTSELLP